MHISSGHMGGGQFCAICVEYSFSFLPLSYKRCFGGQKPLAYLWMNVMSFFFFVHLKLVTRFIKVRQKEYESVFSYFKALSVLCSSKLPICEFNECSCEFCIPKRTLNINEIAC